MLNGKLRIVLYRLYALGIICLAAFFCTQRTKCNAYVHLGPYIHTSSSSLAYTNIHIEKFARFVGFRSCGAHFAMNAFRIYCTCISTRADRSAARLHYCVFVPHSCGRLHHDWQRHFA